MKRCFINVAIGLPYVNYQNRFVNSCKEVMPNIDVLTWTDRLPEGSKSYSESMYGFKMYAFREAFKQGYDSVIWLDSPTVLKKDISFMFDILEASEYGEVVVSTDAKLYQYVNDDTLNYFNVPRQEAKNKGWMLNYGFIFGFLKDSPTYKKMFACEIGGLFTSSEQDHWDHLNNSGKLFNGEYVEHRHEESIISMIVQTEGRGMVPISAVDKHLEWEKTPL